MLDIEKAIDLLLTDKYLSEFEVIDGLSQHPKGINYYEWLLSKGIITKKTLEKLTKGEK